MSRSTNVAFKFFLLLKVERVVTIMQNPRQYKIPDWFLNRQKDIRDGKYSQVKKEKRTKEHSPTSSLALLFCSSC